MTSLHGPVFISYEPTDGLEAALWLAHRFSENQPAVPCWVAETNITDPDTVIDELTTAIQTCSCFVLVVTKAAVVQGSRAAQEWKLALKYKKAIILATTAKECETAELPPHLARRPQMAIKVSNLGTFRALMAAVLGTATNEGLLITAQNYMSDAELALTFAPGTTKPRIEAEIEELKRKIASLSELCQTRMVFASA
jgi:hypothetical protein